VKKYRGIFEGYYLAIQISSILLCSVFGSLFCGIWLDKTLGTRPWLMLILMIAGIAVAMIAVYRTVKEPPK
jgi:F0F1-type ATP synthase assembly protein I